mmetsp:Transcript_15770/g.50259  ORF Transcript_15770/g.50259 Transcript_15770/m.50259 type:complete len:705 (+) Transcript_15770:247-2361(+)
MAGATPVNGAAPDDAEELLYASGQKAVLFARGSGQVYYPSGRVAVVVARSTTANGDKYQRYFYDDDAAGTLIGSLDELVVGGAQESTPSPEGLRFVSTRKGGILSTHGGTILSQWKHDRNAQDAGKLPPLPLVIRMNENLTFTFAGRNQISVMFRAESVTKEFDCSEQLRRRDCYLDNCTREVGGKLTPKIEFQTLRQRQNDLALQLSHLRGMNRPCSKNIKHSAEIKQAMRCLEAQMRPWDQKIREGEYSDTFLDGEWRHLAEEQTIKEIPRQLDNGKVTRTTPAIEELGRLVSLPDGGSKAEAPPRKWPSELEVRLNVRERNPMLRRSFMLRAASGRYSLSLPVSADLQDMRSLPCLDPAGLEQVLSSPTDKIIVIVCLRDDDSLCNRARQLFGAVLADVQAMQGGGASAKSNQAEGKGPPESETDIAPCTIFQFAMSHSRYMTERFGVHTLPAFLMFHKGRLVKAAVMGAKPLNLVRENEPPRALLVEPTRYQSQLQMEKLLKKLRYESDLAISARDALGLIKFRAGITSPNAITFYGLILIDSELSASEARSIVAAAEKAAEAADGGCCLVVSLLPMGSAAKGRVVDGLVCQPSLNELIEGVCHVAATRPLKSTTMDKLHQLFVEKQCASCGKDAAEPRENSTHYGFKKADIVRAINQAYASASQDRSLPANYKLGMRLAANRAVFRGVRLEQELDAGEY